MTPDSFLCQGGLLPLLSQGSQGALGGREENPMAGNEEKWLMCSAVWPGTLYSSEPQSTHL